MGSMDVGRNSGQEKKIIELSFVVPWGIIGGKGWGDPHLPPVLMVHGIQDNAGSFDRIVPLLPNTFYYVCMDLPGHGKSSRFPKGTLLDFMTYLSSIRRVILQLKWTKYHYIGHSFGGQLGSYYAALYPEEVTKLVMLDTLCQSTVTLDGYLQFHQQRITEMLQLENKLINSNPPNYTHEEVLKRIVNSRKSPISIKAAEALLPRAIKKTNNDFYYFTADQRLKFGVSAPVTKEQHLKVVSKIECPLLLVITNVYMDYVEKYEGNGSAFETLKLFQKKGNVQIVRVLGHHDVHNDNPEIVAPLINKFLLQIKSAL